ncbi:hypothetical protein [Salimicrobium halophilum]|uniref:Uncharacterized protein n=1 Tax=Salimicrobium halophilum TaxID=86666 RepID=A0A1G8QWQ8_9BACI|nr:hypothetical protein [Salimicrobium halophilum]SDJ09179.1 hypothetical protein SAMN04490247_0679 [Salimicrobium halophilum]
MNDIVIYNEDADTTEYGVYKNDLYMLGWEDLGGKEPNALPFSYWREYFVANDHRRDNIKSYYEGLHVHILNRIQKLTDAGG